MKNWRDENLSSVQEYFIDYDQYIEKCLKRIDDIDERRFAEEVILDGLGKAIQCMENKYRSLEHRVYQEIEIENNQYETVTTIIRKTDYDPVNRTLFPICPEDLEDTCLLEQLSSEQEICFVKDEIFPMESRKILVLKFKENKQGCYLNDSMVRFAVSQMQLEIGEYRCVGVVIK